MKHYVKVEATKYTSPQYRFGPSKDEHQLFIFEDEKSAVDFYEQFDVEHPQTFLSMGNAHCPIRLPTIEGQCVVRDEDQNLIGPVRWAEGFYILPEAPLWGEKRPKIKVHGLGFLDEYDALCVVRLRDWEDNLNQITPRPFNDRKW